MFDISEEEGANLPDLRDMELHSDTYSSGNSEAGGADTAVMTPSTPTISSPDNAHTPSSYILVPSTAHTSAGGADNEEGLYDNGHGYDENNGGTGRADDSSGAVAVAVAGDNAAAGAAADGAAAATPANISSSSHSSHSTPLNLGPNNSASTISTDFNNNDDIEIAIPDDDLKQRRSTLASLLDSATSASKEGDIWFLIPRDFLEDVLNLPVETFEDLKQEVGILDLTNIVDRNGILYPEADEPVDTYNIPPKVFKHLTEWFGVRGQPVSRALIFNQQTGRKEVERFPSYFHIHTLKKSSGSTSTGSNTLYSSSSSSSSTSLAHLTHGHIGSNHNGVFCSTTGTFLDLFEAIRVVFLKVPKRKSNSSANSQQSNSAILNFRVWFISTDSLPHVILIQQFINDVPKKQLVLQNRYNQRLKDQGLNSSEYHILVELKDTQSGPFPIDNYFQSLVKSGGDINNQFDLNWILQNGGQSGLTNLGNTCYMNSALQCLVHIPEIDSYFFYNIFEQELNESNPLGYKGQIAIMFGKLLKRLFDPQEHPVPKSNANGRFSYSNNVSVSPRDFKYTVGHHSSIFQGYQQQDSQEFLSWLLDAIHEDLNRIYDKPYCEKPELNDNEVNDIHAIEKLANICWKQNKQRNDLIITDLFTGMYKSTLVCPDCSKTSITFDPFNDVTLPLPVNKKWYHTFKIVDFSKDTIQMLEVELNKTSNYDDLIRYIAEHLEADVNNIFLFEIFNNFFYKDFQSNYNKLRFYPISEIISDQDDIVAYHIPHDPERNIIVPVINSVSDSDKSYNVAHAFGLPLFVVFNKEELGVEEILDNLKERIKMLKKVKSNERENEDDMEEEKEDVEEEHLDGVFDIKYYIESKFSHRKLNTHSSIIHIPHNRANLNNLPSLLKDTAEKRSDPVQKVSSTLPSQTGTQEDSDRDSDDFVVVNSIEVPRVPTALSSAPSNLTPQQLDKEDEDDDVEESVSATSGPTGSDASPPTAPRNVDIPTGSEIDDAEAHDDNDSMNNIGLLFDSVHTLNSSGGGAHDAPIVGSLDDLNKMTLVCQWDHDEYVKFFTDSPENHAWIDPPCIPNPQVEKSKSESLKEKNSTVSLYDCLANFSSPEVLGDQDLWYCPRCQDHKQATKTIQLWSIGDILTIHLKRFESSRSFSDKIDMVVDFPIEGLDMKQFVSKTDSEADEDLIYDLIGIDSHVGGLGGGHYTAYAKNFRDNRWYFFNDSRVQPIDDPKAGMSNAYLLFYRKRKSGEKLLGDEKFHEQVEEGRERLVEELGKLREQSMIVKDQIDTFKYNEAELEEAKKLLAEHEAKLKESLKEKENATMQLLPDEVVEDVDEIPTRIVSHSKKSRSSIDPSEVLNEDINIALRRKQRLITRDNKPIGVKASLHSAEEGGSSSIAGSDRGNSPLNSSEEDNLVSDNLVE